jgi:hypothetical protein
MPRFLRPEAFQSSRSFLALSLLAVSSSFLCVTQVQASNSAISPKPLNPDAQYTAVQRRLAKGWNTWDVNSMTTHVLLPDALAIHVGFKHNTTLYGDDFLARTSVGQGTVFPGPHAWEGSYTQLKVTWKGHQWRVESAHDGNDLVLLITPLDSPGKFAIPATVVFGVDFLWDHPGTTLKHDAFIEAHSTSTTYRIYCTCAPTPSHSDPAHPGRGQLSVSGAYLSAELTQPVGLSTGVRRSASQIACILDKQRAAYRKSTRDGTQNSPTIDAIETTLGWDTIFDPSHHRVISPVSRDWSTNWGGYVLFDWDTFFAATLASIGDKDLAYANAIEILNEETSEGFVPNYARAGEWKSSDRSEPPVGAITVLGLYDKYHDRWLLEKAWKPLLRWNLWWDEHRKSQGYLAWGSDGENQPADPEDNDKGKLKGAILESGLDNSPMYDNAVFDPQTHLLEFADVGLMSMYIADCDALATIADTLDKPDDARSLRDRSTRYRQKLESMWSEERGIFLNKDLHTGQFSSRLSPTNFYPLLANAATPAQASRMVNEHLRNPKEFWGNWVIPAIERDDPAFKDQDYWRGRIWGPMNFLVYLGLSRYNDKDTVAARSEFAQKSFALFSKEWIQNGHAHENYNATLGTGDDVTSSDKFYHWGALLGYIQYLEESRNKTPGKPESSN